MSFPSFWKAVHALYCRNSSSIINIKDNLSQGNYPAPLWTGDTCDRGRPSQENSFSRFQAARVSGLLSAVTRKFVIPAGRNGSFSTGSNCMRQYPEKICHIFTNIPSSQCHPETSGFYSFCALLWPTAAHKRRPEVKKLPGAVSCRVSVTLQEKPFPFKPRLFPSNPVSPPP